MNSIIEKLFLLLLLFSLSLPFQGRAGAELIQTCFKAMALVVRQFDAFQLTDAQIKVLLGFVQEDIENYKKQSQAFSVLASLLARRVLLPEMYDAMQRVGQLLIRAEDPVTQRHCAQLLVTFVLRYPYVLVERWVYSGDYFRMF